MNPISTTRMSSKGQVVIPEAIRKQLNLKEGDQFMVMGEGDVVILKTITAPGIESFDSLIQTARQGAKDSGLERKDIAKAIKKARAKS